MKARFIQEKRDRAQTVFLLCICAALSLLLQAVKFTILPDKYFYDAATVQGMMQGTVQFGFSDSYTNTALLFQAMGRFLPMDSQLWGGIVVWALALPFLIWLGLKYLQPTWVHYMLFGLYSVLLPVFVWNVHKEAVQFFFFLLVLMVAMCRKERSAAADALVTVLLILWSFLFRSYYIVIAAGTAFFLILSWLPWKQWSPAYRKKLLISIICVILFLVFLVAIIKPSLLIQLFDGRMGVNRTRGNDPDTNTIILDVIQNPDRTIPLYIVNYVLAAFRMMFPIELILKGMQYVPFVVLQLCWTSLLCRAAWAAVRGKWKESWPEKRLLAVTAAWYLVAFLFEPDFGSFIRHQASAFPVMFPMLTKSTEV